MKITYIYHSSFCVEFEEEKIVLIFDYYKGNIPSFDKDAKIFIFTSHKHFDHFTRKIFDLGSEYEDITFILSKEMKMNENYMDRYNIPLVSRDKIKYVTYNQKYDFSVMGRKTQFNLCVKTLKSTDAGVAYIVECLDKTIYHAGDLNWWTWNELPDLQNEDMTKRFQKEIAKLKDIKFDVAFLPLDYRQEDKFFWGFDYFVRNSSVEFAFPMHLWEHYDLIETFKSMDISNEYRDRIMNITFEGQIFYI